MNKPVALPSSRSYGWTKKMEWRREPATCRMAIWIQTPTACVSAGPSRTETRWEPMSSMKSWARSATTSSTSRTFARYVGSQRLGAAAGRGLGCWELGTGFVLGRWGRKMQCVWGVCLTEEQHLSISIDTSENFLLDLIITFGLH